MKTLICFAVLAISAVAQDRAATSVLLDLGSMTADEQARAKAAAMKMVEERMTTGELVSLTTVSGSKLKAIQAASTRLEAVPGRKQVVYFHSGETWTRDNPELQPAIDAAIKANVAIYNIDIRR